MFNLQSDQIRRWAALLPADFQEAIGSETVGDDDQLSRIADLINACPPDEVLDLARQMAVEISALAMAQRIRWISWVASHSSLKEFSSFFRDLVSESGDGDEGFSPTSIFAEDIAAIAFVIGARMSADASIGTALAIISEASRQYDASPEYLS